MGIQFLKCFLLDILLMHKYSRQFLECFAIGILFCIVDFYCERSEAPSTVTHMGLE